MRTRTRLYRHREAPEVAGGVAAWRFERGPWRVHFLGRGAPRRGELARCGLVGAEIAEAWARQVHSKRWALARPGDCGEVDALEIEMPRIAATIATADCVPVVVARAGRAMAIHAGWRGIVAGIVPEVARVLEESDGSSASHAWVGPAIGGCCYEVGHEVADAVELAAGESLRRTGSNGRPHVDLRRAVLRQLESSGVETVDLVDVCTRCSEEWLWSYRRDGAGAGRNLTLLWKEEVPAS